MQGVYSALKDGGLTMHQIEYRRTPEEKYLATAKQAAEGAGMDFGRMMQVWSAMNDEQKEFLLRKNILNTSIDELQDMGFRPLTSYRLDMEEFLTITLRK
jgi:hypothetical protein